MWYKKRTIIISTDKRASNFRYDHNIPCVDRNEINNLHNLINSNFETNIKLNYEKINEWISQFI